MSNVIPFKADDDERCGRIHVYRHDDAFEVMHESPGGSSFASLDWIRFGWGAREIVIDAVYNALSSADYAGCRLGTFEL